VVAAVFLPWELYVETFVTDEAQLTDTYIAVTQSLFIAAGVIVGPARLVRHNRSDDLG
jgi:hypothetical protein